jgi:phage shock protein PspC (stress-responsive transcriptional regulator)
MSTPYPPAPRRLMRDPDRKLVGGVCSGLARYLNMDVNLVRILAVVITLFTGIPIVLYLIALFVLPEEGTTPPQPPYVNGPQPNAYDAGFPGPSTQQPYGAPAQPPVDHVWGPGGAPWEQPQTAAQPTGYDTAPAAPEPSSTEPEPLSTEPEPSSTEPDADNKA